MKKKENDLSEALQLKVTFHQLPEFKSKFMISNRFGAFCGRIGIFVLFKEFTNITCPKVFPTDRQAKKFITSQMR